MKTDIRRLLSANGAASYQPGATPQEYRAATPSGLKARAIRRAVGPGFQPYCFFGAVTWGVAPGWYGAGALPLSIQITTALDAESAAVLENIKALLK